MVTCPASGINSVERIRINVDLPEPFDPRIPTISRRLMVMVTLSTARTSRLSFFAFFRAQLSIGRDFLHTLETPSITTAAMVVSITMSSNSDFSNTFCIDTNWYPPYQQYKAKKSLKNRGTQFSFCQCPRLRISLQLLPIM